MPSDNKPMREIDDTAGSAADDRFDEIIKKVKAALSSGFFMLGPPVFIVIKNNPWQHGAYKTHNAIWHS